MLNQVTIFGIISLVNFLTCVSIGTWLLIRSKGGAINISYSIFDFCVAFYAFFYFLWQSSIDQDWGILFFKWCIFGVVLINSAFVHFTFVVLNLHKKHLRQLFLVHAVNAFFCYGSLFLFYNDWVLKYTYGLWPIPSNIFHFYITWWFMQVIYCFYLLYQRGIRQSTGKQRKQYQWIFWATLIAYAGGATNWFVWYGINFPPYLNSGIAIYALVLAYAIFRHQLLGIEVIIKKTIIFAGFFAMAMMVVSAVSTITREIIGQYFAISTNVSTLLSVLITILLYQPTRDILVLVTDRFLFQKKEEIKVILNRLSERVITILDTKQIGRTVLSTLEETFRLESGMIFFRDRKSGKYPLLEYFGIQSREFANSVKSFFDQSDISNFLLNHKPILALDHFDPQRIPGEIKNWLVLAKARVCMPLMVDEDHKGLLVLGKKKSDQEFAQEETDYFPTIASQVSLAIQKALLVETVLEEREAKIKAEHVAERVRFARTIKHEQKNSLAGVESPARFLSMYHVPDLKKAFKENDEEWFNEICSKIDKVSQNICKGVDKVLDIAEASLGGMEIGEQPFRKISFKVIWEDAKESSGVKGSDYETTMPDGFAVSVRYTPFERVLENLIINANDAMKDQDQKLIQLNCSYREIDGKQVAYFEFKDNGPGIPKEIQDKIFQQGFSTKPKPDDANLLATGYGQGLYVCKNNIENIHRGKIWVESEPGEGATFKFWIPIEGKQLGL